MKGEEERIENVNDGGAVAHASQSASEPCATREIIRCKQPSLTYEGYLRKAEWQIAALHIRIAIAEEENRQS